MKIRTDFVTNSSSSSFILAQLGDFGDAQKEAILKYVMENMLGEVILTPESSEEDIQNIFEKEYIRDDDEQAAIRQALAAGKTIRYGDICFECCEDAYGDLFTKLWAVLEETDPARFSGIRDDLSY